MAFFFLPRNFIYSSCIIVSSISSFTTLFSFLYDFLSLISIFFNFCSSIFNSCGILNLINIIFVMLSIMLRFFRINLITQTFLVHQYFLDHTIYHLTKFFFTRITDNCPGTGNDNLLFWILKINHFSKMF